MSYRFLFIAVLVLISLLAMSCSFVGNIDSGNLSFFQSSGEPSPDEPQIIFAADRTSIQPGECVNLEWDVRGEGFFGANLNGQPVSIPGQQHMCPQDTTLYKLGVDMGTDMVYREVLVTVAGTGQLQPSSPGGSLPGGQQIVFAADRTSIQPGECITLEWDVRGEGFFGASLNGQPVSSSGQQQVCPQNTAVYTLCVDMGTAVLNREVMVTVTGTGQIPAPGQPPQPLPPGCPGAPVFTHFVANPSTITSGQSTTLDWGSVTNGATGPLVGSVVLTPGNFGEVGSPGSRQVSPTSTTTYTLTATGCGGTATKSVTVTVQPQSAGTPPSPPLPSPPGGSANYVILYDFLDYKNLDAAAWFDGPPANVISSSSGKRIWLGGSSSYKADSQGLGYMRSNFPQEKLEDGMACNFILTRPKAQTDGYIRAAYKIPGYVIGPNERLQGTVGLLNGCWWQSCSSATKGAVTFRIWMDVKVPGGSQTVYLVNVADTHDGKLRSFDVPIDQSWIGTAVEEFVLCVDAGTVGDEDWACWIMAQLVRKVN